MGDRLVLQLICRKVCWNSLSVYRSRNWMPGTCLSVFRINCRRVCLQVPMAGNCNLATQMQNTIWCGKCGEYHGNSLLVYRSINWMTGTYLPACLTLTDWEFSWVDCTHTRSLCHTIPELTRAWVTNKNVCSQLRWGSKKKGEELSTKLWLVRPLIKKIPDSSHQYLSNVILGAGLAFQMKGDYNLKNKIFLKIGPQRG